MANLAPDPDAPSKGTPCVIYAAKSTEDKKGSIGTQLAGCRSMANGNDNGWEIVGEFSDEGFSAYSGNRGPGLERAKARVEEVAAARGECILLAQDTDRFARGAGDAPGAADHLGEVYFAMKRRGVQLWTVRSGRLDAMRAMIEGERGHDESERKTQSVAVALRQTAEEGAWTGGILADGYRVIHWHEDGRERRRVEYDPDRKALWDLVWDLSRRGYGAGAIVAELDRCSYRTNPRKRGAEPRRFDSNRIRQALNNPFYAGLSVSRGEIVGEGNWPRYVDPEDFYRLRRDRLARNDGKRRGPGRPPEHYALAGLALCGGLSGPHGACGSPMDCVTGHHVRKDGTRSRRYVCREHREGRCGVLPIDAAEVDPALLDNLERILGNVEAISAAVTAAQGAERGRLEGEARDAHAEAKRYSAAMESISKRIAAHHADGDDEMADALGEALRSARTTRAAAETRLEAALDALAECASREEEPQEIASAALWDQLRNELSGRVADASGDVKRLNLALRDLLDSATLIVLDSGIRIAVTLSGPAAYRLRTGAEVPAGIWPVTASAVKSINTGENPPPPW